MSSAAEKSLFDNNASRLEPKPNAFMEEERDREIEAFRDHRALGTAEGMPEWATGTMLPSWNFCF